MQQVDPIFSRKWISLNEHLLQLALFVDSYEPNDPVAFWQDQISLQL